MIESLVGNVTAEKVLLYIVNYGEGHTSGIAETFQLAKSQVRKQLLRLEAGGVLIAKKRGNVRSFSLNPRCLYKKELEVLLRKILQLLPPETIQEFYRSGGGRGGPASRYENFSQA